MMPSDPQSPELRRRRFRPIPVRMLVPNVITLLAICAGLTAIRLSTEGRMRPAVAAIVSGAGGRDPRAAAGLSGISGRLETAGDADRGLYAADRVPDGVAAAGIFRQDGAHAGAAGNGAAGFRLGGILHRALDRLSLAHSLM